MPTLTLSNARIRDLGHAPKGQILYFDEKLRGFGVRVGKTKKSYFAEKRVDGKTRRVSIGSTDIWGCDQARKEVLKLLGQMASGVDPNAADMEAKVERVTLADATKEFFASRNLMDSTAYVYRRALIVAFDDWRDLTFTEITGEMVLRRFRDLSENRGPGYGNLAMRVFRSVWNFARARYRASDGSYLIAECPVSRISEARMWNKLPRRQSMIKRSELPSWYEAVSNLNSEFRPTAAKTARDFLLLLLFTGLRKNEGASLAWDNVDFDEQTITIPQTKNGTPLVLPMSTQIEAILRERRASGEGEFVFPGRGKSGWLVDSRKFLPELREKSGVHFTHHDLRRTFLTIAESIDISHYALKRLANHCMSSDVTAGYIVTDVERLRAPMQLISDELERLCKVR